MNKAINPKKRVKGFAPGYWLAQIEGEEVKGINHLGMKKTMKRAPSNHTILYFKDGYWYRHNPDAIASHKLPE